MTSEDLDVWMPMLDGKPILVPDRQFDMLAGLEHRWYRSIVVTGHGSRVRHTALDLAYWWAAGDWKNSTDDAPRWDSAQLLVAHPDDDHELLVLDCDEADAWVQCLEAMDRISGGGFCAADLKNTRPE